MPRAGSEVPLKPFGPADFERHYHFPHGDAAGQKIAIAEFVDEWFPDDVAAYCRNYKRPVPKIKTVPIHMRLRNRKQVAKLKGGARNDALGDAKEVMMDTEIIAGLCPKAAISVYFAHDTQKGWVDMLDRVIKDRPVVFSMSWGATEDGRDWAPAAVDAINERLHVAAALGITICAARATTAAATSRMTAAPIARFRRRARSCSRSAAPRWSTTKAS